MVFLLFFNIFPLFIVEKDALRPRVAGGGFAASVASLTHGTHSYLPLKREKLSSNTNTTKGRPVKRADLP